RRLRPPCVHWSGQPCCRQPTLSCASIKSWPLLWLKHTALHIRPRWSTWYASGLRILALPPPRVPVRMTDLGVARQWSPVLLVQVPSWPIGSAVLRPHVEHGAAPAGVQSHLHAHGWPDWQLLPQVFGLAHG